MNQLMTNKARTLAIAFADEVRQLEVELLATLSKLSSDEAVEAQELVHAGAADRGDLPSAAPSRRSAPRDGML
jgi:hypothetical protein